MKILKPVFLYSFLLVYLFLVPFVAQADEIPKAVKQWDDSMRNIWIEDIKSRGFTIEEWGDDPYISNYAIEKLGYKFCSYILEIEFNTVDCFIYLLRNPRANLIEDNSNTLVFINNKKYEELKKYRNRYDISKGSDEINYIDSVEAELKSLLKNNSYSYTDDEFEKLWNDIENILNGYIDNSYYMYQALYLLKEYKRYYEELFKVSNNAREKLIDIIITELGKDWRKHFYSWL